MVSLAAPVGAGAMFSALFRFHARSGLRIALRGPLPAAALLTVAVGTQSDPGALVTQAAWGIAGRQGGSVATLILAGAALGIARWASGRLGPATEGWVRHLPAGATAHRRAMIGALMVAQAPLLALTLGLVLVAASDGTLDPSRVLALPLIFAGAAQMAAPAGAAFVRVATGLGACACGIWGHWAALGPGLMLLGIYDMIHAPLTVAREEVPRFSLGGEASSLRLASRALGIDLAAPFVLAALPLGAGVVMIVNNALEPPVTGRVVRLTAILAASQSIGLLAAALARALPLWAWARSLPGSAARRVIDDALLLSLPALASCGVALFLDVPGGLAAAACVPALALRGAGWMRPDRDGRVIEEWRLAAEGAVLAGVVCLVPWMAAITVACSPLLLVWAARRERVRLVVPE